MANYNEQLIRAWDEWEEITGNEANDPDDFIDWAIANGRLHTPLEDVRKIHRRRVSEALRQVQRVDAEGTVYRGKQCVTVTDVDEDGNQRQRSLERFPHELTRRGFLLRRCCDSDFLLVAGGQHGWHERFHRIFGIELSQRSIAG